MGDANSKEEILQKVVEDGREDNQSEGKQESPAAIPKLLSLLKLKDQPPDKDGGGDKDGSSASEPKLFGLLKARQQGNSDDDQFANEILHTYQSDSEPEIIDLGETDIVNDDQDNEINDSDDLKVTNLLLDESNNTDIDTDERESSAQKSLTLLEILQSGKESEFRNSSTKPKIAEVLKNKDYSTEWKKASKTTSDHTSTTPKLLHFMKNDDLQAKLGHMAKARNPNKISAKKENDKTAGVTESKGHIDKNASNSSDKIAENKEGKNQHACICSLVLDL